MAEIAIGAAISFLDKTILFLSQENPVGLQPDVQGAKDLLSTLQTYLRDTQGQQGTAGFMERVRQVRDVAFEMEDALEKFMIAVPKHSRNHTVTKPLRKIVHSVTDFPALRRLSSQIKAFKARIESINNSDSFRMGHSDAASTSSGAAEIPPQAHPSAWDNEFEGMEKRRDELISHLHINSRSSSKDMVISVLGDAGSGKTTVMDAVYKQVKNTFACHAWVPVQRTCEDMLEKLCAALGLTVNPGIETLRSHLQLNRYLVVLDGMLKEDEWDFIKTLLPRNDQGSRIIISTRDRNLASSCASSPEDFVHVLDPLTWKEGWKLFCKKAFRGSDCPDRLVECSVKIVKRCEGLPLAIVGVGNLASKLEQSVPEFESFHSRLENELGRSVELSYAGSITQSYRLLSHELKSCFLYFCNFPEDKSVKRGRLLRLWIAERLVKEEASRTLEEVAYGYLKQLVDVNLVHVSEKDYQGRVKSCRVLNLMRSVILFMSENENFSTVLSETRPNTINSGEKTRRLSLQNYPLSFLHDKDLSRVRTLFMFGGDICEQFSSFEVLRVLDLEDACLDHFPKEIIILTLRYLSLRTNTKIKTVPEEYMKKLRNLVTLDLRQTAITKLPKKISKLRNLLYLLVGNRKSGVGAEVDSGICNLTSLEKLSLIKANNQCIVKELGSLTKLRKVGITELKEGDANNQCIVKELGSLTKLRKLGITELKEGDGEDLCASIEKMENLSSLYVASANGEILKLDYHMQKPPRRLHSIYLVGHLPKIPDWILSLNNLVKISLKWSKMEESPVEALKAIPLMELRLFGAFTGKILQFEANWFQELRMLKIEECCNLHTVWVVQGALPKLEKLTLGKCQNLKMLPLGIRSLTHLKEMHLDNMPWQVIRGIYQTTGEDYLSIEHIRDVFVDGARVSSPDN